MARKHVPQASRDMANKVGFVIRKCREANGLSQESLAEKVGVHRTQIGFIERGENTLGIFALATVANGLERLASDILKEAGY